MIKVLILCTGNSCRSQMAEGILRSIDSTLDVRSAGTAPAERVHPKAVAVMREIGIDISKHSPKNVSRYLKEGFDFVITVCDNAKESCPFFSGTVTNRLHIGFEDPAEATGADEEITGAFRRIRDEIMSEFKTFHRRYILTV
jgi:arsenate reductase